MRKLILISFLLFCAVNCSAQPGWILQPMPFTYLNDIQFLNTQTGFVVGDQRGQFAKTTDGGSTWIVRSIPTYMHLKYISFINEQTGWIGGDSTTPLYTSYDILSTTNSGLNWTLVKQVLNGNEYLGDIHLISKDSSIVTNARALMFETYGSTQYSFNGGSTFTDVLNYSSYSINFLNKTTGWVCSAFFDDTGYRKTWVNKTTNSGKSWNAIFKDTVMTMPTAVRNTFFLNENMGFLCGDRGRFALTTDGGSNWIERNINTTSGLNGLHFFDANTGYAYSYGTPYLRRTTDGGITWTAMNNVVVANIRKIVFADNFTGWGIGNGGLMKTITGGLTDVEQISSVVPDNYSLSQNYPNPFNPATKINYELPISDYVSLKVYDMLGNEIETLVSEKQNPGSYSVVFNAVKYPSGVYFYKLVTEKFSETKKMLLVK